MASLQWTVNSYGILFAAGIVTAAALGDRFGRRAVFHLGLLLDLALLVAGAGISMAGAVNCTSGLRQQIKNGQGSPFGSWGERRRAYPACPLIRGW